MGMYTEISFGAVLKEDIPDELVCVIRHWFTYDEIIESPFTEHDFFRSERCLRMIGGSSQMFNSGINIQPVFDYDSIGHNWVLLFRNNLKNYDQEIEKFIDWIRPYVESGVGEKDCIAVVCYEEGEPVIYNKEE